MVKYKSAVADVTVRTRLADYGKRSITSMRYAVLPQPERGANDNMSPARGLTQPDENFQKFTLCHVNKKLMEFLNTI